MAASLILFLVAFTLLLIVVTSALSRANCAWYSYQTERETRYAAFVGCMVKTGGGWVPRTELRTAQ
ncbi:hypothetical protein [Pseudomonas sp. PS01300]|uniref:hypothetical protein n=1 Tax=Pseudomonas sp. PS01300 TaxID=2991436 RepID=UPI00249C719F|nr:hypothetical protein [Pseudomonas sp. PS01300]